MSMPLVPVTALAAILVNGRAWSGRSGRCPSSVFPPGSRISTFSVDFAVGLEEPRRPQVVLEPALGEEPALAVERVRLARLARAARSRGCA